MSYSNRDGSNRNIRFNSNQNLFYKNNHTTRLENVDMHGSDTIQKDQTPFKELTYFLEDPTTIPKITETNHFSLVNDSEQKITSTPLNNSNVFFNDNNTPKMTDSNNEKNLDKINSEISAIDDKNSITMSLLTDNNHVDLKKNSDKLNQVFPTPPSDDEEKKKFKFETKISVTHTQQESLPPLENLDDTLKIESESSWIAMNKNYHINNKKFEEYTQTLTLQSAVRLNVDSRYQIYVTNVQSPLLFWVQLKDFERILSKLHSEIKYFNLFFLHNSK